MRVAVPISKLEGDEVVHVGDTLHYVPGHAKGDVSHRDVEAGVVTSITHAYIFVKFGAAAHGLACRPDTLMKMVER